MARRPLVLLRRVASPGARSEPAACHEHHWSGPTDAGPLTAWAELLMAPQTLVSLITIAVVISRAVSNLR